MKALSCTLAAVAIGRNEGKRLERCLASLSGQVGLVVYVDSGSTDGSVIVAREAGAEVVELDLSLPFTAARARNAGAARAVELCPEIEFFQFLDGDCELVPCWLDTAVAVLEANPPVAVVCGRRRERFPEATLWNRLIDAEWDTPVGETKACGGDALIRRSVFNAVGGYRAELIAGEEPEMCYRMRQAGWSIRRIDAEMTLHDAELTRFSQWWQRNRRAGHTYAEGSALHGGEAERYYVRQFVSAVIWGVALPATTLIGALLVTPWAVLLALLWPGQILRLCRKGVPSENAFFLVLGKFPEAQGAVGYWIGRMTGKRGQLIEYK